jgi:hypothetical protein
MTIHHAWRIGVFSPWALVLVLGVGSCAQSRPTPASSVARDLNSTLAELMRAASRTNQDLANLQQQGGRLHWVTFRRGDKAQKAEMIAALRRNLQFAVPDLIHDTEVSGGSISTSFKLYKDLTVVCESLDSLLPPGSRQGKTELAALNNELSAMNQLKEELSSYIQQTAASIESRNTKRVIVEDNIPEKSPRKRHPASQ